MIPNPEYHDQEALEMIDWERFMRKEKGRGKPEKDISHCGIALVGVYSHFINLRDRFEAYSKAVAEGKSGDDIVIVRGFEYTVDGLKHKIEDNIEGIRKNIDRFKACIETGRLPPFR